MNLVCLSEMHIFDESVNVYIDYVYEVEICATDYRTRSLHFGIHIQASVCPETLEGFVETNMFHYSLLAFMAVLPLCLHNRCICC